MGKSGDAPSKGGGQQFSQASASKMQSEVRPNVPMSLTRVYIEKIKVTGGDEPGSAGYLAGEGSAFDPKADSKVSSEGTTVTGKPMGSK
jgi:hypothetical protein